MINDGGDRANPALIRLTTRYQITIKARRRLVERGECMTLTRSLRNVLACAGLLVVPSLAHAQSVAGIVRDASGGVLPGVSVEAASPVLIEKARTAVTDSTGQYRITDLPPGIYSITFTLASFATVKRENLELSGAAVVPVNAEMRVGNL